MSRSIPALLVAPALALFLASSCYLSIDGGSSGPRVTGSGVVASEVRVLNGFSAIDTGGAFRLEVEVGAPHEVVVTSDDNLLGYIETTVGGDELRVRTNCRYKSHERITVRVRTPELRQLDLSGSHQLSVTGLDGGELELDVSGSVDGRMQGRVDELRLDSSGSSDLDLGELVARRVWLDLNGSSSVLLNVEDELAIDTSGSSTVRYRGRPAVTVDQSGSGSVKRVD